MMKKALLLTTILALPTALLAEQGFYVVSNKADGNTVMAFTEAAEGIYVQAGEYATGGKGTGDLEIPALQKDPTHPLLNGDDPLISAHAITANDDGSQVVVVNAGDGTISLLNVGADKSLSVANTVAATDQFPISVAVHGDMVVAASVGADNGNGSIGFYHIQDGQLVAPENNRRDLKARPSTIRFSADGKYVIVNELVTGKIHSFGTEGGALSDAPINTIDSPRGADDRFQAIPVGFAVRADNTIVMTEARFLTPEFGLREEAGVVAQTPLYSWQTGSLSTYKLDDAGMLSLVSGDVLTGSEVEGDEIANCWVTLSHDGKMAWAANALSSSLSSFSIDEAGAAHLMNQTAYKDPSEVYFYSDNAVSKDGSQLYQLVGNTGDVKIFDIEANGDLSLRQVVGGLPGLGAYGLLPM